MAVSGKLAQDADASTDMMPFYPHCAHHHSAPYRLSDPVPHIPFVVPRTPLSVHILLGAVYHPPHQHRRAWDSRAGHPELLSLIVAGVRFNRMAAPGAA